MTAIDIDAIRKLTDAATGAPWATANIVQRDGHSAIRIVAEGHGDNTDDADVAEVPFWPGDEPADVEADAEFIAAARTVVPALCDELEQTRTALTASRENAANLANEVGALKAELERMRTPLTTRRERLAAPDTTEQICGETPGEFAGWFRCTKPAGHTGDRHFSDFGVGTYSWGYVPSETEAEATR